MLAVIAMCVSGVVLHEGFSSVPYRDKSGWAIGFGYSVTKNPLHLKKLPRKISEESARGLVRRVCELHDRSLRETMPFYRALPVSKQYVLLDMSYNLGFSGVSKFDKTLRYVRQHKYVMASKEMLNSKWALQTKSRAVNLSNKMRG